MDSDKEVRDGERVILVECTCEVSYTNAEVMQLLMTNLQLQVTTEVKALCQSLKKTQ